MNTVIFCYEPLSTALNPVWILILRHSDGDFPEREGGRSGQRETHHNFGQFSTFLVF